MTKFHSNSTFYKELEVKGQITKDSPATADNHLLNKSEVTAKALEKINEKIVDNLDTLSSDTTLSTSAIKSNLDTKQGNLSVKSNSSAFISIVNDEIEVNLGGSSIIKDTTSLNFSDFLSTITYSTNGFTLGGTEYVPGTEIFLTNGSASSTENFFYYAGGNDTETNIADSDSFVNKSDRYDENTIRNIIGSSDSKLTYNNVTGNFALNTGTGAAQLNDANLPTTVSHSAISPSSNNLKDVLTALESYALANKNSADSDVASLTTRINNLVGVTSSSDLGNFSGTLITDGTSIKAVVQEIENLIQANINNHTSLSNTVSSNKTSIDNSLAQEITDRTNADTNLQTQITSNATSISNEVTNRINAISQEQTARANAIAAERSQTQTDVANEASLRSTADSTLQSNIDSVEADYLAADTAINARIAKLENGEGALVGTIESDSTINASDSGDSRDGLDFDSASVNYKANERLVVNATITLTLSDNTTFNAVAGDILFITQDSTGSALTVSKVVFISAGEALTKSNVNGSQIELDSSENFKISANAVGTTELSNAVVNDIADKLDKSADGEAISGDSHTHFVSSNSTAAQQNIYWKRTQSSTGALSGTARTILGEMIAKTNGSGNPLAPSAVQTATLATHYQGSCADLSLLVGGINAEANVTNSNANVIATGAYNVSSSTQLGYNTGVINTASNAGASNIGAMSHAESTGATVARGSLSAIYDGDLNAYNAYRAVNAISENKVAVIADAEGAANAKAIYAIGESKFTDVVEFDKQVLVHDAPTLEKHAVRKKEIDDSKEKFTGVDISSGSATITVKSSIDVDDAIIQVFNGNNVIVVDIAIDTANNQISFTANGDTTGLTSCKVLVIS